MPVGKYDYRIEKKNGEDKLKKIAHLEVMDCYQDEVV